MKRKSYQKAKRQTIFQNIAFAFLAMAIFSCSQTGSQFHNTVILPEERISQAIPLEIEDIWYPVDSIYPNNFYVYADSILIVENKKGAGHFLDFYNIPSKSLVASQIPTGKVRMSGCSPKCISKETICTSPTTSKVVFANWTSTK